LRFDSPCHAGDVTLVPGLAMLPPPSPPQSSVPPQQPGMRRRTVFACAALGTVAVMAGLSAWNSTPRSEAMPNHFNDEG